MCVRRRPRTPMQQSAKDMRLKIFILHFSANVYVDIPAFPIEKIAAVWNTPFTA
jgi:hypothetical protein